MTNFFRHAFFWGITWRFPHGVPEALHSVIFTKCCTPGCKRGILSKWNPTIPPVLTPTPLKHAAGSTRWIIRCDAPFTLGKIDVGMVWFRGFRGGAMVRGNRCVFPAPCEISIITKIMSHGMGKCHHPKGVWQKKRLELGAGIGANENKCVFFFDWRMIDVFLKFCSFFI